MKQQFTFKKTILFLTFLLSSLLLFSQNMENYITFKVEPGTPTVFLGFRALSDSTLILVESQESTIVTVGVDPSGYIEYPVNSSTNTVTVYGDLVGLSCYENSLTSLDLSNNSQLKYLYCDDNPLTSLDISNNPQLVELHCPTNSLTSLDISNNQQLVELYCDDNSLTSLDLSKNSQLKYLYCDDNSLTSLDISNNAQLVELCCDQNSLTSLDISNNQQLVELSCDQNSLTSLDLSNNSQLEVLSCRSNSLTSLDLSNNSQLVELYCDDNSLTSLDLSKNSQLEFLNCRSNSLTSLDLSKNSQLLVLYCSLNSLTSLDLSKNSQLNYLDCYYNNFTTLAIDKLYCSLPDRDFSYKGTLYIAKKPTDSNIDDILASNSQNVIDKNWEVIYYDDSSEIPTTGNFDCSTISINDFANEAELSIYPNPADNVIYIDFENLERVLIYNNIGKLVGEYFNNTIDVSYYNPGVYFVEIQNKEGKTQTSKIIIK